MVQILVIFLVASTLISDGLIGLPVRPGWPDWAIAAIVLGMHVVIAGGVAIIAERAGARLDRYGDVRAAALAERAASYGRIASTLTHASSVLLLGWLEVVRGWLGGNLVLVDELAVLIPPMAVFVAGWCALAPIDRRLHEAALVRALDNGHPTPPLLTVRQYVSEHIRHDLLLVVIPVLAIISWTEFVDFIALRKADDWSWLATPMGELSLLASHLVGVLGVLVFMPLSLRYLWTLEPMGDGPMRTRLLRLCEVQGVRCRDLLVWRTNSALLNGAVVGVLSRFRYILLTETLLERLGQTEVEAVMAHEVAHARRRHLPWLMVSMLGFVGGSWLLAAWGLAWVAYWLGYEPAGTGPWPLVLALGPIVFAAIAGLLVFGWVSRRFEQQADAFAAQHLSGLTRANEGSNKSSTISPESVQAMSGALAGVAAYNAIPPERFTWRHGSIRSRQRRLAELVGVPLERLPIDRVVGRVKIAALVAFVSMLLFGIFMPLPNGG